MLRDEDTFVLSEIKDFFGLTCKNMCLSIDICQ